MSLSSQISKGESKVSYTRKDGENIAWAVLHGLGAIAYAITEVASAIRRK